MDIQSTRVSRQVKSLSAKNLSEGTALDRWRQAFDASLDLISILDKNHRIITINTAMAELLDCRPEDAQGKRCCMLVHNTDHPPMACPYNSLLEDGKPHQAEIYDEAHNLWHSVNVTPLYDDNGELIGSIHISRDITHQKRVEQALRESQEQYRRLSEAAMEGILLSRGTTIRLTNQALADMLGHTVDQLEGLDFLKFVAPVDQKRMLGYLGDSPEHEEADCINHEFTCIRSDGALFPIEACTRQVTYDGEAINQTTIRDLTHQKQIEHARADRDRLQGVLEMAGTVCHELNQPLTATYGYLDLLSMQLPDDENNSIKLEQIYKQLKRIQSITRKLTHITQYRTKTYAGGEKIIDLDQSAS